MSGVVTRWVGDAPINSPTVIFGDYLQDQPEIKATKTDGTEIPVHVYVDKVSTHTVTSASDAASGAAEIRGSQLKALGDQAVNALNLYRQIYHLDYPYSKLDLVNSPFEATAQSPASLIYLSSGAFRGEGTAGVSGGQDAARFVRDVVAHETGHQWWGSRISNANMRTYWFIESLAEYSSALFAENVYSRKKYLDKVKSWRDDLLKFNVFAFDPIDHFARQLPFTAYVSGRGKKNVQLTDRHVTPSRQ